MNKYAIKQEMVGGRQEWVLRVNGDVYFSNGVKSACEAVKVTHQRDSK